MKKINKVYLYFNGQFVYTEKNLFDKNGKIKYVKHSEFERIREDILKDLKEGNLYEII